MSLADLVIATAADERFAAGGATALLSAAAQLKQSVSCVFVDCGISNHTRYHLHQVFAANDLEVLMVDLADFAVEGLPTTDLFSTAAYGRLVVPGLVGKRSDRTLYLDADTLAVGPLDDLIDVELHGYAMAAVQDDLIRFVCREGGITGWRRAGIPPATALCNSGVLLIDNALWNETNISEKASRYLEENAREITFPDQEAINAAVAGGWVPLDQKWNVRVPHRMAIKARRYVISRRGWYNLENARILHFAGAVKPWDGPYVQSAYQQLYVAARRQLRVTFDWPLHWSASRWWRTRP